MGIKESNATLLLSEHVTQKPKGRVNLKEGMIKKITSGYYRPAFNIIAGFYDLAVKLLFLPFGGEKSFRMEFVEFLTLERGERVLDICCGTGTLSIIISERVGATGIVVGVDLSRNMLRLAKRKVKNPDVEFVLANAELLPFRGEAFHKATCSLGLHEMTCTGRRNSFYEIRGALKRNGSLCACEMTLPRKAFERSVLKVFLKTVEEDTAYDLVFKENLLREIEESGFKIARRKSYLSDVLQMVSATLEQRKV